LIDKKKIVVGISVSTSKLNDIRGLKDRHSATVANAST
jgi:hypothetical protein